MPYWAVLLVYLLGVWTGVALVRLRIERRWPFDK